MRKRIKKKKPQTIGEFAKDVEHEYWKPLIFKIWGDKCVICSKQAQTAHHFYPKGTYRMLRFNLNNGVPLCNGCHFQLHHVNTTLSNKIVDRRGIDWYVAITKKAETIQSGAYSKQWVEEEKQRLIKLMIKYKMTIDIPIIGEIISDKEFGNKIKLYKKSKI